MVLKILFASVVAPAVFAGAAVALAWRPWRRSFEPAPADWGGPAAMWAGYAAGVTGLVGWPPFPPREATQWLLYAALAAACWSFLRRFRPHGPAVEVAFRLVLGVGLAFSMLRPLITHRWGPGAGTLRALAAGALGAGVWSGVEEAGRRRPGPAVPIALLVAAGGLGGVLALSGSVLLGQLAGVVAAALGVVTIAAWWRPSASLAGGAGVVVLIHGGLTLAGLVYADVPPLAAGLALLAPLGALAAMLPAASGKDRTTAPILAAVAAGVPIALALVLSFLEFRDSLGSGGMPY